MSVPFILKFMFRKHILFGVIIVSLVTASRPSRLPIH